MPEKKKTPISHEVNVHRLARKGMAVSISADATERRALAEEHDLLSVERFAAELTVRPWKADGVRITGTVEADITQACVVTLEPVRDHKARHASTMLTFDATLEAARKAAGVAEAA